MPARNSWSAMSLSWVRCCRGAVEAHRLGHSAAAIRDTAPDQEPDSAVGYDGRHQDIVAIGQAISGCDQDRAVEALCDRPDPGEADKGAFGIVMLADLI